jgi:methylenetetrahydrofolate--tRNA-(uracil-5-)-methyltransferase
MDKVYFAARWDKGTADYINCPFTKEEYDAFLDALTTAEKSNTKAWEQIPRTRARVPELWDSDRMDGIPHSP